ncbi:MAG TPA: hypothetical protein VK206_08760, partial [Anaerolineales bacterium]|nr:hypothetical protein [Anaerolineales bacterium]
MPQPIHLNGINGSTGQSLDNFQLTAELLAKVARRKKLSGADLRDAKLRKAQDQRSKYHFGVSEGIDIGDLSQAGWGVIFPASLLEDQTLALKDALSPLLTLRHQQASRINPNFYKEFIGPALGYRAGESKNDFLRRYGRGPGAANPQSGIPFYLLIVGSPEEIPFEFQHQLDLQYGVGRIHFDKLEDYAIYAQSVVSAEKEKITLEKKATFFGPSHDYVTGLSSRNLVSPLAEKVLTQYTDWNVRVISPAESTKSTMSNVIGGNETPALLFTASHGLGFNLSDPRQIAHTGALLCQDFSNYTGGPISEEFYFSADDVLANANVAGMLAFFFACYGAGSPRTDSFFHGAWDEEKVIAPYAFLSRLPLRMLSHPTGGALGVFAHVDRAWAYSFMWDDSLAITDVETFRSMLGALLNGKPAGAASDYFGARYGEIAAQLSEEIDSTTPEHQDDLKIAWWWTANNDARNYTFIGDPAVR